MKNLFKVVFVLFVFVFAASNSYAQDEQAGSSYELIKKGFYIDVLAGNMELATKNASTSYSGFGAKFGSKWYFGAMENVGLGFQINWLRIGYYANSRGPIIMTSPLHIGFTSITKINDKMGIEGNINFGYNLNTDVEEEDGFHSVSFNPEIKFRYTRWSAGIDYVRSIGLWDGDGDALSEGTQSLINFSAGIKF